MREAARDGVTMDIKTLMCVPVILECADSSILKLGIAAGTDTLDTSLGSLYTQRENITYSLVSMFNNLFLKSTSHTRPLLVAIVTNVPATVRLTTSLSWSPRTSECFV